MERQYGVRESIGGGGITRTNSHRRPPSFRNGKGRCNFGNDLVMQYGVYGGTLVKFDEDIHL